MVTIILVIVAAGVLGVGYIRGWFDAESENVAYLTQVVGVVNMERSGVIYPVEGETVLRTGDKITTLPGASVEIRRKKDTVTAGGNMTLIVVDPSANNLSLNAVAGELFVNTEEPVRISFELGEVSVENATVSLSVRSGAQTVGVFRGSVCNAKMGQAIEYVGHSISICTMRIESLNDFLISQIRKTNQTITLCYTNQDLDDLADKRQQAIQDLINGSKHTHDYVATIVEPGCGIEGYTEYVCKCGEQYKTAEIPALEHNWGQWTTEKAATTQEEGLQKRTCQRCGALEQRTIDKIEEAHTHSYTVTVIAPSCGIGGYTEYVCACGEQYSANETAALEHDWGQWTTEKAATTQEEGLQKRTCQRCQAFEQRKIDKIEEVHAHSYTVTVIAPSCGIGGYTEYVCKCGDQYKAEQTPALAHSWGKWTVVKEATLTEEGVRQRICQNCQLSEQEKTDKLPESHVHRYTSETVAPTCTAEGYTVYTCLCGHSYTDNILSPLTHSYTAKVVKPTCEAQGYTVHTCTCGAVYTDTVTSAAGHKWSSWKTVKEATESEEGLQERACSVCAEKEQQILEIIDTSIQGYVYLEIRCDTILDNMGDLKPGKEEFVPEDGTILPMVEVPFYKNETVFEVLNRVCALAGLQIEYSWTPLYGSYYIEGINHLYEFDCGLESGWMYKVNEWFPNYGCSSYYVKDGDVIVWCYTCKGLGADVGDVWTGES